MLTSILVSQQTILAELARSWLASGATAYAVWADGRPLVGWPEGGDTSQAEIIEPVCIASQPVMELRVAGLNQHAARMRLQAEARLISSLIPLERELESMAEELVDTRDQLVALYSLSQATQNCQEILQVMERIVHETIRLARAEGAFLFLKTFTNEPWIACYPEEGWDLEFLLQAVDKVTTGGLHLFRLDPALIASVAMQGNLLMVPIQARGAERAALGIVRNSTDYRAPDIKLVKAIAEYTGMHIDNFLMFQRSIEYTRLQTEMDLAKRVHARLLPKSHPQISKLDVGMVCLPASQVGGDFYDYVENPGQPFTFMVGDISGKGMPAALLMAMTRTLIRKEARDHSHITPEAIIRQINTDLYNDFTELGMFATVLVGKYDPDSRQLIYANAGHSPVYFYPAGGEASLLIADGVPMGILPLSQSKDQCIQMQPGDIFLVGTDGLIDACNRFKEYFGYDRLCMMIEALHQRPAQEIAEIIVCVVGDFADKGLRIDDQTLFVLKCTG